MISNQHFPMVRTAYVHAVKMRHQARAACKNIFYFVLIKADLFSLLKEFSRAKISVKRFFSTLQFALF